MRNRIFFVFTGLILLIFYSATMSAPERPRVGLVLSGGGARGLAHIGVLQVIDSLGIPVDYIAGTSMGAIVGALYSIGYRGTELDQLARREDWMTFFTDRPARAGLPYLQKKDDGVYLLELGLKGFTPVVPGGLVQGQKISLFLNDLVYSRTAVRDFSRLPIPFRCVAIDLVSGREVVLDRGPLPRALRASMSLPTIFDPVDWGDSLLIDGGILNNFPADVVKDMGAEVIIGVNVGTRLEKKSRLNSLVSTLTQTITLTDFRRQQSNSALCDLVISPDLKNHTTADFERDQVADILRAGRQAAHQSRAALRQLQTRYHLYKPAASDPPQEAVHNSSGPVIHGLTVTGNERIPFEFIYNHLQLRPGVRFDREKLNEHINQLYALGYFEEISYSVLPLSAGLIRLNIEVKEKPVRKLRLGYHYDSQYKFVGIIGMQATNFPLAGTRIEGHFQFAGRQKLDYTFSYPSRQLNLPIIPYLNLTLQNLPVVYYDWRSGRKISDYEYKSFRAEIGLGLRLFDLGLLTAGYVWESVDIKSTQIAFGDFEFPSFRDKLGTLSAELLLDELDDVILPRHGFIFKGSYQASSRAWRSDLNYQQIMAEARLYHTFSRKHTVRLAGFYTDFLDDLPVYKYPQRGGSYTFVGVRFFQITGNRYGYGRLDYRYEFKKDIFVKFIANAGAYAPNEYIEQGETKYLFGYGLGLKFLSIIGPFEFILSRGSRSLGHNRVFDTNFYFSAGIDLR